MRKVTEHVVPGDLFNQLTVTVTDEPGDGGACHRYVISWPGSVDGGPNAECEVNFQNGPIKENDVNGITQEVLLAIVIDRLRSFQAGPFACDENELALMLTAGALRTLQNRTRARIARGVEGTHNA
jgi:hypothetical protein